MFALGCLALSVPLDAAEGGVTKGVAVAMLAAALGTGIVLAGVALALWVVWRVGA